MEIIRLSLLNEGRLEDVKRKWLQDAENPGGDGHQYKNLSEDDIDFLSQEDPSGNNKYLAWMVGILNQDLEKWPSEYLDNTQNYINDILSVVTSYHNNLARVNNKIGQTVVDTGRNLTDKEKKRISSNPKDINSFESLQSLQSLVEVIEEMAKESPQRDKIYEDDRFIVVVPKTHSASCKYGAFSNWCVSTSNESYYKQYTEEGMLAFVIWKEDMADIDKSGAKDNDNVYKLAIEVQFKEHLRNGVRGWKFWNKRDYSQDNTTIRNLLPKGVINSVEKYLDRTLWEKGYYQKFDWSSVPTNLLKHIKTDSLPNGERRYYLVEPNTSSEELQKFYDDNIKDPDANTRWGHPLRRVSDSELTIVEILYSNYSTSMNYSTSWDEYSIIRNTLETAVPDPSKAKLYPNVYDFDYFDESIISNEELKNDYILPLLYKGGYTEEDLKNKTTSEWSDVNDSWGTVKTSELRVGDRVKWENTTGGGYRRSDWGYNSRRTDYFEGTITNITPSGYRVVELDDGTKKRFKTAPRDKNMYIKNKEKISFWDIVQGNIPGNEDEINDSL
jgi:hypothetical protein